MSRMSKQSTEPPTPSPALNLRGVSRSLGISYSKLLAAATRRQLPIPTILINGRQPVWSIDQLPLIARIFEHGI